MGGSLDVLISQHLISSIVIFFFKMNVLGGVSSVMKCGRLAPVHYTSSIHKHGGEHGGDWYTSWRACSRDVGGGNNLWSLSH